MRRIALSLIAACSVALVAACSGGTGFSTGNNSSIDRIVFTNGSGQVNDFFVSPTGSSPIQINAVGLKGSGPTAVIVPNVSFDWSATYATPGTTYTKGGSPTGTGTCGTNSQNPAIDSLLQQGGAGAPYPLYANAYTQLPSGQGAQTIYVGPPTELDSTGAATTTPIPPVIATPPATAINGFCVNVVATQANGSVQGNVIVVVSNSP